MAGGIFVDVIIDEARDPTNLHPFKGNVDLGKLDALIRREGADRIAHISLAGTVNMAGGQPVSIANLKALRELRNRRGIRIFVDPRSALPERGRNTWRLPGGHGCVGDGPRHVEASTHDKSLPLQRCAHTCAARCRRRCATDCRSRCSRGTRDARRCVAVVARVTTLLSLRSGQFAAARGEPIDLLHYVQVTIHFVASERECTAGGSLPQGDRQSRSFRSCPGFRFRTATRFGIAPCCMRPIAPQCFRVSGHRPDERTPLRAVVSCAARIAIAGRVRRAPARANSTL